MCNGSVDRRRREVSAEVSSWRDKREADDLETDMTSYGSLLQYRCGLARSFHDPEEDLLYEERNMTCNWNMTWTPQDRLDSCVWTSCLYPPVPHSNTSLAMLWAGDPVEFHANVSYVCQSEDLYFEWDREMMEFNVTCLPDGSWQQPEQWPICLKCESKLNIQKQNFLIILSARKRTKFDSFC